MNEETDDANETASQLIQNVDGKFNVSMPFARHLDRKRRRTIESKTETKIKVPRHSQSDDGHIEICGSTRSAVESAMKEIEKLAAQKQRRLTHFLSIPINNKGIVEKFSQFKNDVCAMDNLGVTSDNYFQKACKLHITLGVLALSDNEKKTAAIQALEHSRVIIDSIKTRFNNPDDLLIRICGVACMNNEPSKCRVLYGVVESEILQTIVNEIVEHFISKGLIEEDKNQVKLHVTLMNVIFVTRITKNCKKTINACGIIEKYLNYEFGEQSVNEIHLSRFERTGEFNYYDPEAIIRIS